jgi:transportin-3
MDDYVHLVMSYLTHLPALTLTHPSLAQSLSLTLTAVTLPAPETILGSLDVLSLLSQKLQNPQFQPYLQPIFAQYGKVMIGLLLKGLIEGFPEDGVESVADVIGGVCAVGGWEVEAWVKEGLEGVEAGRLPIAEREKFCIEIHE